MEESLTPPSRFWAGVAVVVGALLLFGGATAALGYLGLPGLNPGDDVLGEQLGQMAGAFLGLVCGALAVYHGLGSLRRLPSRPLHLPPFYVFWIAFAVVLGLGNLLLTLQVASEYLFPILFLLGAALPTVALMAWAAARLGWPITWRLSALPPGWLRPMLRRPPRRSSDLCGSRRTCRSRRCSKLRPRAAWG